MKTPIPSRPPIRLHPAKRWALGSLGAAGMLGGSLAVFTQPAEAGPTIMIGIGAAFFLLGVVGLLPVRLRFGDTEAEWQSVADFIEDSVDDIPVEDRAELLVRLNELNRAAPEAASPALNAVLYEQAILEWIREIAHDVRPQIQTESQVGPRAPFDMYVTGPTGRRIAIETFGGRQSRIRYRDRLHRFRQFKEELDVEHLLIVASEQPSEAVMNELAGLEDVSVAIITGREDLPSLRREIFRRVGPVEP